MESSYNGNADNIDSYFNYNDLFENFESDQSNHFNSLDDVRNKIIYSSPTSYFSANGSYIDNTKEEPINKGTSIAELENKIEKEIPEKKPEKKVIKENYENYENYSEDEDRYKYYRYNDYKRYENNKEKVFVSKLKSINVRSKELKEFLVIMLVSILVILMMDLFTKINLTIRKV